LEVIISTRSPVFSA